MGAVRGRAMLGLRTPLARAHRRAAVGRRVRVRGRGPGRDARRYAYQSPLEALPTEAEWPELQELCVRPVARDRE